MNCLQQLPIQTVDDDVAHFFAVVGGEDARGVVHQPTLAEGQHHSPALSFARADVKEHPVHVVERDVELDTLGDDGRCVKNHFAEQVDSLLLKR